MTDLLDELDAFMRILEEEDAPLYLQAAYGALRESVLRELAVHDVALDAITRRSAAAFMETS